MALINFSGIASGIDTGALINALIEKERTTRILPLENNISELTDTNSALNDLSSKLATLSNAVEKFRTINGGALSFKATSSDESIAIATAGSGATIGTYNLNISSLASNATFSFDDRFSNTSDTINSSIDDSASATDRTVSFTIGSGSNAENIDIVLTSSTTVEDFVNEFNTQSKKASATLTNVGTASSPQYAIVINSNDTGIENGSITLNSVGSEIQTSGSGAFTSNTLDQATDLQLQMSGVSGTITRGSNTVSDLISGVTFTAKTTGSVDININVDDKGSSQKVEDFVNAYNDLIKYINENDAIILNSNNNQDSPHTFSPLTNTNLDESIISVIRDAFSSSSVSGGTVNTLADLGISTNRDGTLSFNSETFSSALSNDTESTATILNNLGETLGGVQGSIAQFTQYNGLIDKAISNNEEQISNLNNKIKDIENYIKKEEETLTAQFSRLESLIGGLTAQQNALASLFS